MTQVREYHKDKTETLKCRHVRFLADLHCDSGCLGLMTTLKHRAKDSGSIDDLHNTRAIIATTLQSLASLITSNIATICTSEVPVCSNASDKSTESMFDAKEHAAAAREVEIQAAVEILIVIARMFDAVRLKGLLQDTKFLATSFPQQARRTSSSSRQPVSHGRNDQSITLIVEDEALALVIISLSSLRNQQTSGCEDQEVSASTCNELFQALYICIKSLVTFPITWQTYSYVIKDLG